MPPIPRDTSVDSTLALLREGYEFIPKRSRRYRSDIFETRLMLRRAICVTGYDAARMFYEGDRFTRKGAMPPPTLHLLQDKGSVQLLDGDAHRWRKRMFISLLAGPESGRLADAAAEQWHAAIPRWAARDKVVLLDAVQEILCRAACAWAGVPLAESDVKQRTRELAAMVEGAGSFGPRNWWAQLLRRRTERWIRGIIEQVRGGQLAVPEGRAAHVVAWHRDPDGSLLAPEVAAVELINLLRPTVAVALFAVFAALALHDDPEWRRRFQAGEEDDLEPFVQEVRRFYPFFPLIAGHARHAFDWRGYRFTEGTWVLLDLYGTNHDGRLWEEPGAFRPERFRGWGESTSRLVPQGAGDELTGHRCPGEWATIELMKRSVGLLTTAMRYDVPEQDLGIDLSQMPAIPHSRFVISGVRATG